MLAAEAGDHDVTVGRLEGLVGHGRLVRAPDRHRDAAVGEVVLGHVGEERDLDVQQAEVDVLAAAGPESLDQGGADGQGGEEAAAEVADRDPAPRRLAARLAGDRHAAAHGLDDEVEGGQVAVGPVRAEGAQRAGDQVGLDRAHGLGGQAEAPHDAVTEVVDHRVGGPDQLEEDLAPSLRAEVDGHALLVPVDGQEVGALPVHERRSHGPDGIALLGVLDLDHLGPHVRQQHGRVGPRQHPRQVDDPDALQGVTHRRA